MNNPRPSQLPAQKATPSQLPPTSQQQVPETYQAQPNWVPASSQIQPGVLSQPIPLQQTGLIQNPQYLQQPVYAQQQLIQSSAPVVTQGNAIKGESRIEYIPYTKEVTEYVTQEVVEYVPRERKITDYYAVEYVTEHIPQVIQEKYIEYVPVETIKERTEYQAVTKQSVVQAPIDYQQIQKTQQYQVAAPIQYAQTYTQPIQYAQTTVQPIQYAQTTTQFVPTTQSQYVSAPVTTSQFVSQPYPTTTYGAPITNYGQLTQNTAYLPAATYAQPGIGQVTTTTQQYSTGWQQVYPASTGNFQPQLQQQQVGQLQIQGQSPKYA
ncbi:unnamed protein product (macronuclear) [Paramecium tetraurelia]|uniref:Chromosome undetermined scaffold_129, whole genome shotgun sequence n=1 Tax=Paramecium tetraurelia TaxID=5888 RepID=Q3SDE3_PARTE|nr:uncharacterized protein GSPATT00032435001 [Paramecium tetraurelia]CAI39415.1 EPI11 [Paramecium tetraurelia]CAK62203.1 unnamed protein product [Paramecium tetraurelia]|eukprot:XP_001429601.1 hypothetical protein (macronuclear) [Paramecium tetraurelia strain d4-2]